MKNKVLVIGGATLDMIIAYEDMETMIHQCKDSAQSYLLLEEGKKIEVLAQQTASGGGATNAAVAFKRQGYEVDLFCKLGRDVAGEMVLRELEQHGISTVDIRFDDEIGTATSFVVPSLKGDRTVFAYRGANANVLSEELPWDKMHTVGLLYVTSLSRASAAHLPHIVTHAKKLGMHVVVNPGVSQLKRGGGYLRDSLEAIDTLILNEEEAKILMVSMLQDEGLTSVTEGEEGGKLAQTTGSFDLGYFNLREFFQKILSLGPSVVVVTNGSEGVYVATPEQLYFHAASQVNVVNTLGAGDAFGSGFTGTWHRTGDVEEAIRSGIVNSASVIGYPDAKTGLLPEATLQERRAALPPQALTRNAW
jgi:ribokinase